MELFNLTTIRKPSKNRGGRGIAAGQGKTVGRGTKGQKSRTGYKTPKRIPGMMSASTYRLPKRKGFKSYRQAVISVTLRAIEKAYHDGETVSPETLAKKRVIKVPANSKVKIIAKGELVKKLKYENLSFSKSVTEVIKKIG